MSKIEDEYPVFPISRDWVKDQEEMGSKEKVWVNMSADEENDWLFKFPRSETGEHWAEKIAEQMCRKLGITHAKVELATLSDKRGSISKSFLGKDDYLIHGNAILNLFHDDYDRTKKRNQKKHTFRNIFEAIEILEGATSQFAEYLILDALIGNTDRHHENWGVLIRSGEYSGQFRLAATFDHASSLGRELLDSKRELHLKNNSVPKYSKQGRGAVYWSTDDTRCPNPFELVRLAKNDFPENFASAFYKLEKFDDEQIKTVVNRVPGSWISKTSRDFTISLLNYNLRRLQKL